MALQTHCNIKDFDLVTMYTLKLRYVVFIIIHVYIKVKSATLFYALINCPQRFSNKWKLQIKSLGKVSRNLGESEKLHSVGIQQEIFNV